MAKTQWIAAALMAVSLGGCDAALSGAGPVSPETPMVAGEDQGDVRFGQVMTGAETWRASDPAPAFEAYEMPTHCRLPRASGTAKVYYLYTYGGGQKVPLHVVWRQPGSARMDTRKRVPTLPGNDPMFSKGSPVHNEMEKLAEARLIGNMRRADVVVTDTDQPVYLVLASYDEILWNLQLAPGVMLDGVSVISYEGAMVANAPEPERVGFISMRNSPNAKCYESPKGREIPVAERVAGAKKLNPDFDERAYLDRWRQDIRDTRKFHTQTLPRLVGARAGVQLYRKKGVGADAVLMGPVPEVPFAPQPVTSILYQSNMIPLWGTRKDAEEAVLGKS
ncbi:hypothetical protein [Henriciella aquimarina]|uniref:hypothetical protein n=1 Tax=Henriciella aquimarina TaxID=545261 RepID=UPI00117B4AA6|nr:hypothetical protein [Henriciella aquimarina]